MKGKPSAPCRSKIHRSFESRSMPPIPIGFPSLQPICPGFYAQIRSLIMPVQAHNKLVRCTESSCAGVCAGADYANKDTRDVTSPETADALISNESCSSTLAKRSKQLITPHTFSLFFHQGCKWIKQFHFFSRFRTWRKANSRGKTGKRDISVSQLDN